MNEILLMTLTVLTIALSGFVQSVTGFGFGLVSMTLLVLFRKFDDAYVIVTTLNLVVCGVTFAQNWQHYRWRHGLGLLIGSCIGVPIGFYVMTKMNQVILMRSLGALICIFAATELIMGKRRPLRLPEAAGLPMGLFSGSLSGAFNMGGPPAVAYVYSQNWTKEQIVALLQVVFGTSSIIRLFLVQSQRNTQANVWGVALAAILPLLLALFGGNRLLKLINREVLRYVVFIVLFIMGARYILQTISFRWML